MNRFFFVFLSSFLLFSSCCINEAKTKIVFFDLLRRAPAGKFGLDLGGSLYLGGLPDFPKSLPYTAGFKGETISNPVNQGINLLRLLRRCQSWWTWNICPLLGRCRHHQVELDKCPICLRMDEFFRNKTKLASKGPRDEVKSLCFLSNNTKGKLCKSLSDHLVWREVRFDLVSEYTVFDESSNDFKAYMPIA